MLFDDVLVFDSGRLLVGGSPLRAVRLSARAAELLAGGTVVADGGDASVLAARLLDGNLAFPVLPERLLRPEQVTVVVPVRDRPAQLDRCLEALAPLQTIVVDDASERPDAVARVVARHGARHVVLTDNLGPAGARNAGLEQVTTPFVAFVDSDVTATPETLLHLGGHFGDELVCLVGPLVDGTARSARPRWFERYDAAASSLDLGTRPASVSPGASVGWLPGACLVVRAEVLRSVGGFNPSMRVGEDVDLVWRLVDHGHRVRYEPSCRVGHDTRSSMQAWLARKFIYGTGGGALGLKHGDAVAPARMSVASAVVGAALLLRRRRAVPAAVGSAVWATLRVARTLPPGAPRSLAVRLVLEGTMWAARQESSLLLRHWWPLTAIACARSTAVRRAVLSAAVLDLAVFVHERPQLDLPSAAAGRRLDDLAYGLGLWVGAVRHRSVRCLLPRLRSTPRR
ncbi:mycofactocin biosynthesis glycosyltransferase MftF [Nocardioides KLBMP 9356]|uniref:Mycofactocin biosynthesis glycosyltransferase MftF n=1 Tax=Nocardioides potassii TaxID=2911371 RepID=A0ABS9HCJ0_9ACTN|nr:mycofactocin biosynthesis glycosyltransferase MftF [Nocardioides potassii]MCF6378134.1 mycofactocin biosynthesis glycosyltransferase MftF [Nocardioides potassii]